MTIFFAFSFFSFMSTLKDFLPVSDVLNYIDKFLGLLGNTELGKQVTENSQLHLYLQWPAPKCFNLFCLFLK